MANQYTQCPICHEHLNKNGKSPGGRQRWRCSNPKCHYSQTGRNTQSKDEKYFRIFLTWLLGKHSLAELAQVHNCSAKTLRRRFQTFCLIHPINPIVTAKDHKGAEKAVKQTFPTTAPHLR